MTNNSGFTLIEILIAVAIAAIFLPAIATIFSLALQSSSQGEKFSQAYSFAQKGMEEIFYQKTTPAWSWTTTSDTSNPIPNTPFSKRIQIIGAVRCGADSHLCDCSIVPTDPGCPGTVDTESRKIIISVSWLERTPPLQEVKLEAYVTKH